MNITIKKPEHNMVILVGGEMYLNCKEKSIRSKKGLTLKISLREKVAENHQET